MVMWQSLYILKDEKEMRYILSRNNILKGKTGFFLHSVCRKLQKDVSILIAFRKVKLKLQNQPSLYGSVVGCQTMNQEVLF